VQSQVARAAPAWFERLVLAAGQFVVRRATPPGTTVIAGYHWFGDWGRDTMIALPGLTLATGRPDVARDVLREFAKLVDGGMLPNTVPAPGETAEYNTVDAALWFVEAVRAYVAATHDRPLLDEIYPVVRSIQRAYADGTRFGIHEDPADGLIAAGEAGVQLTWMDAKVGDHVITPRYGKPVEIAALWLNALATLADFAVMLGARDDAAHFESALQRTRAGFERFWNGTRGFLFDVLDGPGGSDATFRPNQLFAVSLNECALSGERQRAVVGACARELVTTYGLRTLAPGEAGYCGTYRGDPAQRDGAYHQGTVWPWLMGPFALAHARAYGDPGTAASFVAALGRQLDAYGLGTLGELADGDAPHAPGGTIAQAWSVAEVLRAWTLLASAAGRA
jgi:predicted glycogen debranching enzyme